MTNFSYLLTVQLLVGFIISLEYFYVEESYTHVNYDYSSHQ